MQFRRNSPVFWCFEILCQDIRYRVAHACGSRCTRGCKYRAPLWFTENIRLPMWILSIVISIIDQYVHWWSTTKLMKVNSHESWSVASNRFTKGIQAMVSLNIYNKSFQWGSNIRPRPSSFEIGQFGSFCDFIYVGVKAEVCATGEVWVNR